MHSDATPLFTSNAFHHPTITPVRHTRKLVSILACITSDGRWVRGCFQNHMSRSDLSGLWLVVSSWLTDVCNVPWNRFTARVNWPNLEAWNCSCQTFVSFGSMQSIKKAGNCDGVQLAQRENFRVETISHSPSKVPLPVERYTVAVDTHDKICRKCLGYVKLRCILNMCWIANVAMQT